MTSDINKRKFFYEKIEKILQKSEKSGFLVSDAQYDKLLLEVKVAQVAKKKAEPLTSKQYRRLRRYAILDTGETQKLIGRKKAKTGNSDFRYFCKASELFDILEKLHTESKHMKLRAMEAELKKKYCNITRDAINVYLSLCKTCQLKKKVKTRAVIKRIPTENTSTKCKVDIIDMQNEPDGDYKYILNYEYCSTKFIMLRPLKSATAEEVASQLLEIICVFGIPSILQCVKGHKFSYRIIQILELMWPEMKLMDKKPRYFQNEELEDGNNEDVLEMLTTWRLENDCDKWSEGLKFVQFKKNQTLHPEINMSPHEAMFGFRSTMSHESIGTATDVNNQIKIKDEPVEILESTPMIYNDDYYDNGDYDNEEKDKKLTLVQKNNLIKQK